MLKIEFEAVIGDVKQRVELAEPTGAGGAWQVYINKYYQGTIVKVGDEWISRLNPNTELSGDDIGVLSDIIETYLKQRPR